MKLIYEVLNNAKPNSEEHAVKFILGRLDTLASYCDELKGDEKIKALSFLYDKCADINSRFADSMGYQTNYEPSEDEILAFIEERNRNTYFVDPLDGPAYRLPRTEDGDLYDDSGYIQAAEDMISEYEDENRHIAQLYGLLEDWRWGIEFVINREKDKIAFFQEVHKEKKIIIKTTFKEYLTCSNSDHVIGILEKRLPGEKGIGVAIILTALEELGYIDLNNNKKTFFRLLEREFNISGNYNSVTSGFRAIKDTQNYTQSIDALKNLLKQSNK